MKPLDLNDLGHRVDDPKFYKRKKRDRAQALRRPRTNRPSTRASRNIILTDDYAPVENLLAPVAETRGDD